MDWKSQTPFWLVFQATQSILRSDEKNQGKSSCIRMGEHLPLMTTECGRWFFSLFFFDNIKADNELDHCHTFLLFPSHFLRLRVATSCILPYCPHVLHVVIAKTMNVPGVSIDYPVKNQVPSSFTKEQLLLKNFLWKIAKYDFGFNKLDWLNFFTKCLRGTVGWILVKEVILVNYCSK